MYHPRFVAVVDKKQLLLQNYRDESEFQKIFQAIKLIWKPRYSTMGLGVESFRGALRGAPSEDPYMLEERLQSYEYE